MLKSLEGIYRNGRVELEEQPDDICEETRVIVTFLDSDSINLQEQGINESEATELRARLVTFADEWNSDEMEIYNNYDNARQKL